MINKGDSKKQPQIPLLLSTQQVDQIVQQQMQLLNQNPIINEEINLIMQAVQTNFQKDYSYVKNMLADQMVAQFCMSLNINSDINEKKKIFNKFLEGAGCLNIEIIKEKYKNEIQIANQVYNDNWMQLFQEYSSQPFISFKYYNKKLKDYEIRNNYQYLQEIRFEPQIQQDQFKAHCLQVFNDLYHNQEYGIQKFNFKIFNQNTEIALNYAKTKFQQIKQRLNKYYPDNDNSQIWMQKERQILDLLYETWKEGMTEQEIDKLLNFQTQEEEIHLAIKLNATIKAFIELGNQFGHYYLFDEEFEMINNNKKILQIIELPRSPAQSAKQFYEDIRKEFNPDIQIEDTKNFLIDKINKLNLFPINCTYIAGKVIQFVFNQIRNQIVNDQKCSFYHWKEQETGVHNLHQHLMDYLNQNLEIIRQKCNSLLIEFDQILTKIRDLFKTYIKNVEEYQQVINKNDPQFQQIIYPTNQICLDDDQVQYLEQQIDEFQKFQFLYWLNKTWNLCKEELHKYQTTDEQELMNKLQQFSSEITQTISNQITELDQDLPLVKQFRQKWRENKWEERIIDIFVETYKD